MTSAILIIIPTLCYMGVAVSESLKDNWPMATVFAGYSVANLGFIWGLR